MHPFRPVRARVPSIVALALVAVMTWQAPAYAETAAPTPACTDSRVSAVNGVEPGGSVLSLYITDCAGITSVSFGSTAATSFTTVSATSLSVVTPALKAGTYEVVVTNAGGTALAARYTVRTFEAEVLRLVNVARSSARKCGSTRYRAAPALRADALLAKVAAAHSQDMADHSYFSHTSRTGESPFTRMKRAGYSYDSAGENIAAGFRTPASVVKAWLKSAGHCKNIMRRGYTELGVGYATGGLYGTYWTQDFGNPR